MYSYLKRGVKISQLPKLKLKPYGYFNGNVCEFEKAKNLNYSGVIVLVDGKKVGSFDEFVQLATQDIYKNREFIEVVIMPIVAGG